VATVSETREAYCSRARANYIGGHLLLKFTRGGVAMSILVETSLTPSSRAYAPRDFTRADPAVRRSLSSQDVQILRRPLSCRVL